jgi:hypothetical protein
VYTTNSEHASTDPATGIRSNRKITVRSETSARDISEAACRRRRAPLSITGCQEADLFLRTVAFSTAARANTTHRQMRAPVAKATQVQSTRRTLILCLYLVKTREFMSLPRAPQHLSLMTVTKRSDRRGPLGADQPSWRRTTAHSSRVALQVPRRSSPSVEDRMHSLWIQAKQLPKLCGQGWRSIRWAWPFTGARKS